MIDYQDFCEIKTLSEQDRLTAGQIARQLNMNIKTVRKWLGRKSFEPRVSKKARKSILDPYKERIKALLNRHSYSGRQIFDMIHEQGYTGGVTTVRDYVGMVRPPKRPAYLTLAFAPGEAAQVDWGHAGTIQVGNTRRQLSFFVMVLGYSRMVYVEFTLRQSMEFWLSCHRNAFEFFGGVPQKVIVDNCKTAVLSTRHGQAVDLHPTYSAFAGHYGFAIRPCTVRSPHEKGQVENAVGYVRKSLLNGLNPSGFDAVGLAAEVWRDQVANKRLHGTTGKAPLELFKKEKPLMLPLPFIPFDCCAHTTVRSSSQFRIRYDSNSYSVPACYASIKQLALRAYPDRLCVYSDNTLIADHARSFERNRDFEHPDHPKPLLEYRRKARHQKLLQRFFSWGTTAEAYYHGLGERCQDTLRHVRQLLTLEEIHGRESVLGAMEDAVHYQAFSSDYITNLLEQRKRKCNQQPVHPLHLSRNRDVLDLELQTPDLNRYNQLIEQQQNTGGQQS